MDVAYLHRLETGRASQPGRDILIRIGIGLGLDVEGLDELLMAAGDAHPSPETGCRIPIALTWVDTD